MLRDHGAEYTLDLRLNSVRASIAYGRSVLKGLAAFLDEYYIGPRWSRKPDSVRTWFVMIPEVRSGQIHFHGAIRLPKAAGVTYEDDVQFLVMRFLKTKSKAPSASVSVQEIYDPNGLATYDLKCQNSPLMFAQAIYSNEFRS